MITLIENYITDYEQESILRDFPLTGADSKVHNRPSELADFMISNAPDYIVTIAEQLHNDEYFVEMPDAFSIHEYLPGQSIKPHIDDVVYGDVTAVISVLGTCTILFEKQGEETIELTLTPNSLLVFSGSHRTEWTHYIPPVDNVRVSMVIRKQN